jgi:hypothetical protein
MKDPERQANEQQHVEEPRTGGETVDEAVKRAAAHFVDPYDMRAEPQPEEPGYGHGV